MKEEILAALGKLDPQNDDHWTGDGLPRIDKLGIQGLKRADITAAAPQFTRDNPTFEIADPNAGQPDPDVNKPSDDADAGGQQNDPQTQTTEQPAAPTSYVEELQAAHLAALEDVQVAEKELAEANKKVSQKRQAADEILVKLNNLDAGRSTTNDIQDYLARQNELRQMRAKQHQAMMQQFGGLAPKPLSKLDQSMQRKTGYGNQRPVRGAMVETKE